MNEEGAWEEVLVELVLVAVEAAVAVEAGALVSKDDMESEVVGTEAIEPSAVAAEFSPEDNGGFEDTDGENSPPRCFSAADASWLLDGASKP